MSATKLEERKGARVPVSTRGLSLNIWQTYISVKKGWTMRYWKVSSQTRLTFLTSGNIESPSRSFGRLTTLHFTVNLSEKIRLQKLRCQLELPTSKHQLHFFLKCTCHLLQVAFLSSTWPSSSHQAKLIAKGPQSQDPHLHLPVY